MVSKLIFKMIAVMTRSSLLCGLIFSASFHFVAFAAELESVSVNKSTDEQARLQGQVAAFQTQIKSLLIEKNELENKLAGFASQSEDQKKLKAQGNELVMLRAEVEKDKKFFKIMQDDLTTAKKKIEAQDSELVILKSDSEKSLKSLVDLQIELDGLRKELSDEKKKRDEVLGDSEESQKKITAQESELEMLRNESEKFLKNLVDLQAKFEGVQKELTEKKMKQAEVMSNLDQFQKKIEAKDVELLGLRADSEKARKSLEVLQVQFNGVKKELADKNLNQKEFENTVLKLKSDLTGKDKSIQTLEENIKNLKMGAEAGDEDLKKIASLDKGQPHTKLSNLDKDNIAAHYNLSVFYSQQAKYKEAVKELEYVLRLDPAYAPAHFNLALLLDKYLSRPLEAASHYATYIALLPNASDVKDVEYRIFEIRLNDEKGIRKDLKRNKF